ncbi:MAG: hypothetical protein N2Z22_11540, partial [Turneriella sp.]|nr:hypothetical protein [Turneriella sp.]
MKKVVYFLVLFFTTHCRELSGPKRVIFREGFATLDTTPPAIVGVRAEAGYNQILVEFDEPVFGTPNGNGAIPLSALGYTDNNAAGATAITGFLDANGADKIIVLTTNHNVVAGDFADLVHFTSGIFDAAGNALSPTNRNITIAALPPQLTSAETMDTDKNGRIDHYKLTFNRNLQDNTFPGYLNSATLGTPTAQWQVAGKSNIRIDPTLVEDNDNDNVIYLRFDEAGPIDTAETPDLTTGGSPGLLASNGAALAPLVSASVIETDGAVPLLYDATEKAGERELVLSFSEPVFTQSDGTGNLQLTDFNYTNSHAGGATAFSAIVEPDGSDRGITIQMDANFVNADHNTDRVSVVANQVFDARGLAAENCRAGGTGHCEASGNYITTRITAGDAPVVVSAETMDVDKNGKIDHIKLVFDVPVNDASFPGFVGNNHLGSVTPHWFVSGYKNVRIDTRDAAPPMGPGDTVTNDNTIYLAFDERSGSCADNYLFNCDTG